MTQYQQSQFSLQLHWQLPGVGSGEERSEPSPAGHDRPDYSPTLLGPCYFQTSCSRSPRSVPWIHLGSPSSTTLWHKTQLGLPLSFTSFSPGVPGMMFMVNVSPHSMPVNTQKYCVVTLLLPILVGGTIFLHKTLRGIYQERRSKVFSDSEELEHSQALKFQHTLALPPRQCTRILSYKQLQIMHLAHKICSGPSLMPQSFPLPISQLYCHHFSLQPEGSTQHYEDSSQIGSSTGPQSWVCISCCCVHQSRGVCRNQKKKWKFRKLYSGKTAKTSGKALRKGCIKEKGFNWICFVSCGCCNNL